MTAYDLAERIAQTINQNGSGLRDLLQKAEQDIGDFEAQVASYIGTVDTPLRSELGRRYDLYADLHFRHLQNTYPVWHQKSQRIEQIITRYEVHEAVGQLMTVWLRSLQKGQRVTIVADTSLKPMIALLAGFRMGLCMSVIPQLGTHFIYRRLIQLAPEAVVYSEDIVPFDNWPTVSMSAPKATPLPADGISYAYNQDEVALEMVSPFTHQIVQLSARQLHYQLAVSTYILFGLRSGAKLTALESEPIQGSLIWRLSALLGGATWVYLVQGTVQTNPQNLDIVIVSTAIRDEVLSGTRSPNGWKRWIKSPAEPHDGRAWQRFGQILGRSGCVGQNVLNALSFGGCMLFSRVSSEPDLEVYPSPGSPWALAEPGFEEQPAASSVGILALTHPDKETGFLSTSRTSVGAYLMAENDDRWLFAGSMIMGRRGMAIPDSELPEVVSQRIGVDNAALVVTPVSGALNAIRTTLIVFVNPARDPRPIESRLVNKIQTEVRSVLGEPFVPDAVVVSPIAARFDSAGHIDEDWCAWQLQTGGLTMRSRRESYRLLSVLRRWATQIEAGA